MAITYQTKKPGTGAVVTVTKKTADFSILPADDMTSTLSVKLIEAAKIYQPVLGTSPGSRYYVVALSHGIKIAAAYRQDRLSVRAEGSELWHYSHAFDEQGFTKNDGYRSIHVGPVGGEKLMARTLGSIIIGLGIPFNLVASQASLLVGKGDPS